MNKTKSYILSIIIFVLIIMAIVYCISKVIGYTNKAEIVSSYDVNGFKPTNFDEYIKEEFFYLIGGELKYGNSFNTSSKTLLIIVKDKNKSRFVYSAFVSPDGKKMALGANNVLYVIDMVNNSIKEVLQVDSNVILNEFLQWAPDSKTFYFLKTKKDSNSLMLFGSMYQYDIKQQKIKKIIYSLDNTYKFAIVNNGDVICTDVVNHDYYRCYTSNSDFVSNSKYFIFDGDFIARSGYSSSTDKVYKPFYNYDYMYTYNRYIFKTLPVQIKYDYEDKLTKILDIKNNQNILVISWGDYSNIVGSGALKGISSEIIFLPNSKRYFVLHISTKQYSGSLLFDRETNQYKKLNNGEVMIRPNINSNEYPNLITKVFY
ncbi:hypothetical protein [Francisella sciaenopsi]